MTTKRLLLAATITMAACQAMKPGTEPSGVPGTAREPVTLGIDSSWFRISSTSPTPTAGNMMEWLASHPRLRALSDEERVNYLNRAAEIFQNRPTLGAPINPSQLAASLTWTLPMGMEISSTAAALVFGSGPAPATDKIVLEGSDTGTDHYLAIVSNIYNTTTPTVLKSADLGAALADGTGVQLSLDGTVVYAVTTAGKVWAIKVSDGSTVWQSSALGAARWSNPWVDFSNGNIYVVAGGSLHAISSATGAAVSGFTGASLGSSHSTPIVFPDMIWLGDDSGLMHRYNFTTGAEIGTAINLGVSGGGANNAIWSAGFIDSTNMKFTLGVNNQLVQIDLNLCTSSTMTCTSTASLITSSTYASTPAIFYSSPTADTVGGSGHYFFTFNNRLWSIAHSAGVLTGGYRVGITSDPTGLLRGVNADNGYPRGIPMYLSGALYFGDGGGFLHRFDASTMGEQAFKNYINSGATQTATAPAIDSTLVLDYNGGNVYFAARNSNSPRGKWVQLPQGFAGDPPPSPGPATHLRVSSTANPTKDYAFNVTVTALDASGLQATSYTGQVTFSSSDGTANLPMNYTFTSGDQGKHTFTVTLHTLGSQTITATDTATMSITGSETVTVSNARILLTPSANPVVAGATFNMQATAQDGSGNTLVSYRGTVHFTSSDSSATLPSDYTFTAANGGTVLLHGFVLRTGGGQTVTATDTVNAGVTGTVNVSVSTPAADHFVLSPASGTQQAFAAFNLTVTAKDAAGNTVIGYTGTVHFTSSDASAILPANYTFQASEQGVHTFSVQLRTGGSQSVTVTDTVNMSVTGTANFTVTGGTVDHFVIIPEGRTVQANQLFNLSVYAKDVNGNTITSYTGTVHFTSTDPAAALPANYTFTGADAGFHFFQGVNGAMLRTPPSQSITVNDTATPSIQGNTGAITVTGGVVTHIVLTPQANTVQANAAFHLTVSALDSNNNPVGTYAGRVHFSSTDSRATLPPDYTFTASDNGQKTFFNSTILTIGPTQTITVTDNTVPTPFSDTRTITVTGGTVVKLVIVPQVTTVPAGVAFHLTVYAMDTNNRPVPFYTGTVTFSSTDPAAQLPGNYMFTASDAGQHFFPYGARLNTRGMQTIRVHDIAGGITDGVTPSITVN